MILIPAAALASGEASERIDGGTGIGMRIKPPPALGADAAPLADQQRAAKQVGPDLHPIKAPFVAFRADAGQGRSIREQRQLQWCWADRGLSRVWACNHEKCITNDGCWAAKALIHGQSWLWLIQY